MAVFTEVSFRDAAALVERLGAGALTGLTGISAGIENTNYFADTTTGRYVITLFERLTEAELPFYLNLMRHLAQRGIPVPDPLPDASGDLLHRLSQKPAVVATRLRGEPVLEPLAKHCEQVGRMVARMHLAARDFPGTQPNPRGLGWWTHAVSALANHHLPSEQRDLLGSELAFQQQRAGAAGYASLPRGPIHADLFRDNVLFEAGAVTGLIDFYFAGVDAFAFDIAVCLNDWCTDLTTGRILEPLADSFVRAYSDVRALGADERAHMPALLRAAALRFWLSRLLDIHAPRRAALLAPRDPTQFERILRRRIDEPYVL